jgi:hypothetical protein
MYGNQTSRILAVSTYGGDVLSYIEQINKSLKEG